MRRFGILLELVDEDDGDSFVEECSLFTQRELTSTRFLVKHARDANGGEEDDFEDDGRE